MLYATWKKENPHELSEIITTKCSSHTTSATVTHLSSREILKVTENRKKTRRNHMGVDFRRVSKLKVNDFPIIFETVDTLTFWETLLKYFQLQMHKRK